MKKTRSGWGGGGFRGGHGEKKKGEGRFPPETALFTIPTFPTEGGIDTALFAVYCIRSRLSDPPNILYDLHRQIVAKSYMY
jgi:hypothetical protein